MNERNDMLIVCMLIVLISSRIEYTNKTSISLGLATLRNVHVHSG